MAQTYSWKNIIDAGSRFGKGIPLTNVDALICDMVSSEMYIEYPWKETITTTATAPGMVPLIDGQQDYSPVGVNMDQLLTVEVWNTAQTPADTFRLDIVDDLSVNLLPRSYRSLRVCCVQKGIGQIRLESAVQVPSGMPLELRYDYKLEPTKVVSLNQDLWFKDKYIPVALEGLLYWVYKLSDDPRAGGANTTGDGRMVYSGQYGSFKAALSKMKEAEDFGATEQLFPGDIMGAGREGNGLTIFGP